MKKTTLLICLLLTVLLFSSCKARTHGDTLYGFTQRMNHLSDTYSLNENGYILDQKSSTLSHFYKFGEKEILLQFKINDENILTEMNIVFWEKPVEESEEIRFISNCISAFIDNEETEKALFSQSSLSELLKAESNETVEIKKDDTQLLLDVTEIGTVITVRKNNP